MEPSLIEPTSVIKCPKQVYQSLHNRGLQCQKQSWQTSWWDTLTKTNRGIQQSIAIHGGDDVLTRGSFSPERWTQLTQPFGVTPHHTRAAILRYLRLFVTACLSVQERRPGSPQQSQKHSVDLVYQEGWIRTEEQRS